MTSMLLNAPDRKRDYTNIDPMLNWLKKISSYFCFFTITLTTLSSFLIYQSPYDYLQGINVKIMFIHVPFAWTSILCYLFMSLLAIVSLVWRFPLATIALKSALPIGCVFTGLALISGAIWGKPTWGTWWVWDARLTSFLILFIFYLSIMALSNALSTKNISSRSCEILTLIGAINIPIIKFSVDYWATLHQTASLLTREGTLITPEFLYPLFSMLISTLSLFCYLYAISFGTNLRRYKNFILYKHLTRLERKNG